MFDLLAFKDNIAAETDDGKEYSYWELYDNAAHVGKNIGKRALTFCLCKNTYSSLVGYVAFMSNDIPTVLLDSYKHIETIKDLIQHYEPNFIWTPTQKVTELGIGKVVTTFEEYSLLEIHDKVYDIHPDVLLCLTTSGSTGSPKLVKLSQRNLISNAYSIAEYLQITDKERAITSLPMHYSFGMSVINSHLMKGATLLLTEKTVFQREFLDFMRRGKATSIAGVPYTYEMLRRLRFLKMDFPDLKTMTQAGGKLNAAIVKEYVDGAKSAGKEFIVMYGQTEASPRMSYLPFEKAADKAGSIGIAIPGGKLSIRDAYNKEITESDIEGELIYEGPNVCMGYAENLDDLAKGDENHGLLHTGDVARKDKDGFFYITGRMSRFVKIWGNRCNLDAAEQLVKSITVSCACIGIDDKITIFVTERGLSDKIVTFLSNKTGLNRRAFEVKEIDEIPKMNSGKPNYQELTKLTDHL